MPDSHGQGHDHDQGHDHTHDHDHGPAQGPLADASVRRAGVNDAPAVGYVQAEVWRAAYEGKVPAEVTSAFTPTAFGNAWRDSLATPPPGAHALFVALAGGQVVGFVAVGPSQTPTAMPRPARSPPWASTRPVGGRVTAPGCSTPASTT